MELFMDTTGSYTCITHGNYTVKGGWLFWHKLMLSQFHSNPFLAWEPFPSKEIDSMFVHVIVYA